MEGVTDLFQEAGLAVPQISGSTETNMELVQSAMAVTMIGEKKEPPLDEESTWFTYGTPLVGNEVLERAEEVASFGYLKRHWTKELSNGFGQSAQKGF